MSTESGNNQTADTPQLLRRITREDVLEALQYAIWL